jgi:nitroreductase
LVRLWFSEVELHEVIRRRRMCRDFADDPVAPEVVDRLLDLARRSPSAGHTQGWAFLVLASADEVRRFWEASSSPSWLEDPQLPGLLRAPVIVVPWCSSAAYLARYSEPDKARAGSGALGVSEEAWPAPFWIVDVSFATMVLLLGAVDEGLGALFFGLRGEIDALRAEFGVPPEWFPIGAVAIGWPSEAWRRGESPAGSAWRGRKRLEEVVHRGRW